MPNQTGTNAQARFQVDIRFAPSGAGAVESRGAPEQQDIFTALRVQAGLKLDASQVPLPIWVLAGAKRPVEQ